MPEIKWTPAQAQAISAEGISIAVSAAAGSGKTAVLTRRITERVCSNKVDVSKLLVVTFTRAAAAELVSKIEKSLGEESGKNPTDKRLLRQMLLLPSARISTIDSFYIDLVKEYFGDTGFSNFGIMDGEAEGVLKNDIADELISDYFDGVVTGAGRIDDFSLFADTFGSPSSDSKLRETLVSLHGFYSGCVDRKKAIKGDDEACDFGQTFWGRAIYGMLADFLRHYQSFYRVALNEIDANPGTEGRRPNYEKEADFCRRLYVKVTFGASYGEVRDYLSSFESETKVDKSRQVRKENKTKRTEALHEIRNKFRKEIQALQERYFSFSDDELSGMLSRISALQNDLLTFFEEFDRRLMEEKKRRRMLSFSDTARLTLNLLYDETTGGPTEVAKEISKRFDEIYIDEFQDTNDLQNTIFEMISRGNNLFTVGDIKQSIYDFRGAEPAIFEGQLAKRKKYGEHGKDNAAKIFLSDNFRSGDKIIELVNGVFSALMNTDGETVYGEDEKLRFGSKITSPVPEMHIVCASDDEPELSEEAYVAERIAKIIASGETEAKDIAVLLRTDKISGKLAEELSKRNVPYRNISEKEFFESPEILLAVSLLCTIDNPSRDLYLAAALKSPIYGFTMDELLIIRRESEGGSLYAALKEYTAKHGFEKGKRFLSDNEKFKNKAKICTCGELLRYVYSETKLLAIVGKEEKSRKNLLKLYDYALGFESGSSHGLYSFISFIDDIMNEKPKIDMTGFGSGSDAVNIMTMHASKGLEFDTVFICNMEKGPNTEYTKGNVLAVRNAPLAFDIFEDGNFKETPFHRAAIDIQTGRLADEACRLLYVALTRAKRRLIMTATVKDNTKSNNPKDQRERFDFCDSDSKIALKAELFSSYQRKKLKTMLEWTCIGLAKNPELCTLDFIDKMPETENVAKEKNKVSEDDYNEGVSIANERLGFEYPTPLLSKVPSKLSVSRLYPDVLDENDASAELETDENEEEFAVPVFIAGESESGASHGTAMHTFMQFFDFENVEKFGVRAEIERLMKEKFLFESDGEKLNVRKLEKFFSSETASLMRNAEAIYREKRFIIFYPAENFSEDEETKKALKGEKLMVQGVIDCAVKTKDGELFLIDYKTDFFPKGTGGDEIRKTLTERHSRQLGYYKYACEKLFGRAPDHTYIYSFALDGAIEL